MNSKLFKSWIANAMLAFSVGTIIMAVSTNADAKTKTVQVQDSYTIDEIFTLVKSEYPNTEKLNNREIKVSMIDNSIQLILDLSNEGQVLNVYHFWDNNGASLSKLNELNRKYNFVKLTLDDNQELRIETEVDLKGANKDYILSKIGELPMVYLFLFIELRK